MFGEKEPFVRSRDRLLSAPPDAEREHLERVEAEAVTHHPAPRLGTRESRGAV